MDAVRTTESNFTFLGPTPQVADLPTQIAADARRVYSVWRFTDEERAAIANGAQVKLAIYQVPMPPVSLKVVAEEEIVSPLEVRCACGALWAKKRHLTTCGHCGLELVE